MLKQISAIIIFLMVCWVPVSNASYSVELGLLPYPEFYEVEAIVNESRFCNFEKDSKANGQVYKLKCLCKKAPCNAVIKVSYGGEHIGDHTLYIDKEENLCCSDEKSDEWMCYDSKYKKKQCVSRNQAIALEFNPFLAQ